MRSFRANLFFSKLFRPRRRRSWGLRVRSSNLLALILGLEKDVEFVVVTDREIDPDAIKAWAGVFGGELVRLMQRTPLMTELQLRATIEGMRMQYDLLFGYLDHLGAFKEEESDDAEDVLSEEVAF